MICIRIPLFIILLFSACKKNNVSEALCAAERIAGLCRAVVFSEAGAQDAGIDILAGGWKHPIGRDGGVQ
jgi:hypothetical protein